MNKKEACLKTQGEEDISEIIVGLQRRTVLLSEALKMIMNMAKNAGNSELYNFCRYEVEGWTREAVEIFGKVPMHRMVDIYASPSHLINPKYVGWDDKADTIFNEIEKSISEGKDEFFKWRYMVSDAMELLEERARQEPAEEILTMTFNSKEILKDTPLDCPVYGYMRIQVFEQVIEKSREELIKRLNTLI